MIALILVVTIPLVSIIILLKYRGETEFHGDESGWISSGYYYSNLLLKGDFERQKWVGEELGSYGYINPHVGKWIIGIPLKLQFADQEFSRIYDFSKTYEENEREGNIPPQEMLLYARAVSALLGGLCCLIIFVIGYRCYNLWVGVIAVILLLGNKLFFIYTTRAMTDVSYNLFLLCVCFCGLLLVRNTSVKRMTFGSLLLAISSGLACSVKITGIAIGSLFFIMILLYKYIIHKNKKAVIISFITYCFSTLAIVYILNPLFWPEIKKFRGTQLIYEIASFPEELHTILTTREIPEKKRFETTYPQLTNLARVLRFPYLFVRWNSLMNRQKDRPSASWHGNRLKSFHMSLFINYATFSWEGILLFIGVILCIHTIYKTFQKREMSMLSIPLLYFLINYVFILIFMSLNWERYYLPTIIVSKIIVAICIYKLCLYIHQYFYRSR